MRRFTFLTMLVMLLITLFLNSRIFSQAPFTAGNLVVLRVGDGSAPLTSASTLVFLDEFTTTGTLIQTIAIPSTGTNKLTISGSGSTEGQMTLSPDGYYLILPGYNAEAGVTLIASTPPATYNRKLLRVDNAVTYASMLSSGTFSNTSSSSGIRGGVALGNDYWASGTGSTGTNAIQYFGTGTPAQVCSNNTNLRAVNIFNNQLFYSSANSTAYGISSVGSGLPITSGQTGTLLINTGTGAITNGFAFNSTIDICYISDERTTTSGGVQKWVNTAGTWSLSYTLSVGSSAGARGVTVNWAGTNPVIYATTTDSRVVSIVDAGATSVFTLLNTPISNVSNRGIAFAPIALNAPVTQAHDISFTNIASTSLTANWVNGEGTKRVVKMNTANSFISPADGTNPTANSVYGGSGEQVIYNNNGNSVSITGLTGTTIYWFRVYEYNGSGVNTKFLTTTSTLNPNSQGTSAATFSPTITTPAYDDITSSSATLGGTITSDGGAAITERGTVWKTSAGVTITDNKLAEGGTAVNTFSHTRSLLPAKTEIFFKAYATNAVGTSLTNEASFFTLADEPTSHVAGFAATAGGTASITLSWTAASTGADGYLILQRTGAVAPTGIPTDATGYTAGEVVGDGTVAANVTPGSPLTQVISGLLPGTQYSFTIIPYAWDGINTSTCNYYFAPVIPSASATTFAPPPTIYTWTGAVSSDWTVAGNWSPSRTTPSTNDVILFDNIGTKTITSVITQTIGQLILSNGSTLNLQSAAAVTLTIGGGTGTDLIIPAGCALNLNAINAITLALGTGATGSISGNMTFSATAATAHRLIALDAGAITFNNGAIFTAGNFFSGNAFGTTSSIPVPAANSVIFAAGSTYTHQTGSNPFAFTAPGSVIVFQTGSLYKAISNSTPAFSGRTYANFEMDATGITLTPTGGSPVSLDNLTITNGTMNFNMTGPTTGIHQIKGNIAVSGTGTLNFAPASVATVTLNGTLAQTISGTGTITTSANSTIEISNSNGVTLSTPVTMNGKLKLTNGLRTHGSTNLTLGTTSTITGTPSATAMIVATGSGQLRKGFTAAGSFTFPVGDNTVTAEYSPVTLNFSSGTFAAGNYASVNLVNAKYPLDPNTGSYLNRYWSLAQSGITAFSCNATFQYLTADVAGTEDQIYCTRVLPTPFTAFDIANSTLHQLNANGLTSFSTFTGTQPPPIVVTNTATAITTNSATLNGIVYANNLSTAVSFEYGLTTAYGTVIAGVPITVTGNIATNVLAILSGLTPNTTYHYRVKGISAGGTAHGDDLTFQTACAIPPDAGIITGPATVCKNGSGYMYSVPVIAYASAYIWMLPAGAMITSGANTNSVTVGYSEAAVSGNVSVYGSNVCGSGASATITVTVNPLPAPAISGPSPVCINVSGNVYTTEAGMTGYTWAISAGGSITAGGSSVNNSVTVNWNTTGPQFVSVNYTNAAGCTATNSTVYNVTVVQPLVAGSIAASQTIAYNTVPAPLTGTAPSGGQLPYTYQWQSSSNGTTFNNITGATNLDYAPGALTATTYYRQIQSSAGTCGPSITNMVTISISVPPTLVVQGVTIGSGQSYCYNATQTIYIAGSGTSFVVQNGGTANMIAGQNIFYYPGTAVQSGGYMHGYIAPGGPYCGGMAPSIPAVISGEEEINFSSTSSSFVIYPNPTTGNFTLEHRGDKAFGNATVEVYGMRGEKALTSSITGVKVQLFSLSGLPPGIYFVRIVAGELTETVKLIKQ